MKISTPDNWSKDFKSDGLLYFAQRLEEMLFHYSVDLYKVPILNTNQLILEFCDIQNKIEKKLIKEYQLINIYDEFLTSFKKDVILKNYWGQSNIDNTLKLLNSCNDKIDEKVKIMKYLLNCFSNKIYYKWCEEAIKKIVQQDKEKKQIEEILKCFLPELINSGYCPEYIYQISHDSFFKDRITGFNSLDSFLAHFSFTENNYDVYFSVPRIFNNFRSILEKRLDISFEIDNFGSNFTIEEHNIIIKMSNIKSLDYRGAASVAYHRFCIFQDYYIFFSNIKHIPMQNKVMVRNIDTQNINFSSIFNSGYNVIRNYNLSYSDIGEMTDRMVTTLLSFARKDFGILSKAVYLHNTALSMWDLKSGFLNLWAVLEVICSQNNQDKITNIFKILIPILKKDFVSTTFSDLANNLKINLGTKYNDLLNLIKENTDEANNETFKIACFTLLPEYTELRNKITNDLYNFPLIRSRIFQINESASTPNKFLKLIAEYEQRVKWHTCRLYRTRNAIIHSGDSPKNIKYLGEHLHSYVDALMYEVMVRLTGRQPLTSIENALTDTQFAVEKFMAVFSSCDRFTPEIIETMLHPKINTTSICHFCPHMKKNK